MRVLQAVISIIISWFLSSAYNLTVYESLSLALSVFIVLMFVDNVGKKIVIIDIIGVLACITWLVMPLFYYHYFTIDHYLSRLWNIYMYVPSDEYYGVVFWGTLALVLGLHFPFRNKNVLTASEYLQQLKLNNHNFDRISKYLLAIGIFSLLVTPYVPSVLRQVFEVTGNFVFVAAFYAYYSNSLNKYLLVAVVVGLIIIISAQQGMFGKLVYIIMLASLILMAIREKKLSFARKMSFMVAGIFLIIILQSVKEEFRKNTWYGYSGYTGYTGSKSGLFFDLIGKKIRNPSSVFGDEYSFYALAARFNQGWLISKAINYIPAKQPFVGPGPLAAAIAGGFIPRFLWPDKPEAGGKANMLRYAGVKITTVSMNVAVMGEAYGSFGRNGAVLFMFCFGLFYRWSYNKIMSVAVHYPTLLLWLPSIYVLAVVTENDTLTLFNAFTKSVLMVWLFYVGFRKILKINL